MEDVAFVNVLPASYETMIIPPSPTITTNPLGVVAMALRFFVVWVVAMDDQFCPAFEVLQTFPKEPIATPCFLSMKAIFLMEEGAV